MIKVKRIEKERFEELLNLNLTAKEKAIIRSLFKSQRQYPKLTINKYLLFWEVYNKYFSEDTKKVEE